MTMPADHPMPSASPVQATHIAVGVSATGAMAALTTLLTGWHGFDAAHAAAGASLIVMVVGGAYALGAWFIGWKFPTIPPLPK